MSVDQGWDDAAFACGRCPVRFHASDPQAWGALIELHEQVHEVAEVLGRMSGAEAAAYLPAAAAMVRAIALDVQPAAEGVMRPAWDALVTSG